MPGNPTQRSDAKWAAHLLACRQNLYIARLGQLHPHPAQRSVNEDHVKNLAENMEESAVLKFQHPLEVVLDRRRRPPRSSSLSHLPGHHHASILRGQHRHLAYTLCLRKQIFAASSVWRICVATTTSPIASHMIIQMRPGLVLCTPTVGSHDMMEDLTMH
jgi:hypothetical protein